MTQSHRRSPSSSQYLSKPKSSRPVLHRRATSGINLSISKLGAGLSHSANSHSRSRSKDDESEFDMASFLNFCAMCERQITVPNNTLLYCSEGCRRKDSCKPLSASMPSMSSMTSTSTTPNTPPASPPLSPRTIVAPMTPTRVPSNPPSSRIPSTSTGTGSTDLDPSEWKPVITPGLASHGQTATSTPAGTDAWSYLSQFHGQDHAISLPRRSHRSTTSLPSLSSSVSSSASASDYFNSYEHRPLPPRHNPSYSGTKGVQLVVPHLNSNAPGIVLEMPGPDACDGGSIFPASSSVWEDDSAKPVSWARASVSRSVART